MDDITIINELVGKLTFYDIRNVDYYISEDFGIFIPSVGFCEYAIKSNHTHPSYSFIILLSDSHKIIETKLEPDNRHYVAAVLSPHVPHHEIKADTFTRYMAISISKKLFLDTYLDYSNDMKIFDTWQSFLLPKDIMMLLNRFMTEYEEKLLGYEKIIDSLAIIITNYLIRYLLDISSTAKNAIQNYDIQSTIHYINQHFAEKISIDSLATLTKMSVTNFVRKFKNETGLSPNNYIIKTRLNKVKKLVRSNELYLTEIALQCGFNSAAHLTVCFKKNFGITPSQYKELYSIDPINT